MEKVNVKDIIGKTDAILPKDGIVAYNYVANELQQHHALHLNFEGIESLSTVFSHRFIGKLYQNFDRKLLDSLIYINGIEKGHIWNSIIEESIYLGTNEEARNFHNSLLSALLES